MKKLLLFAGIVFFSAVSAMAQEAPKADVFLGYQYVRAPQEKNLNGFNGSVSFNVNNYLGLKADFGLGAESDLKQYSYLFGPQVNLRTDSKLTPFAHALFGAITTDFDDFRGSKTGFGMALGGGIDYKFSDKVSLRAIQGDYVLARRDGDNRSHTRISAGIVFHIK